MARTKKTKALVKGLKWMTTHEFQVVATNSTVSSGETSESMFPSSLVSAAGVDAGAATSLSLPYAIGASCEAFKQNKSYGGESQLTQFQSYFLIGLSIVTSAEHSSGTHYCTDTCTCHCSTLQSRVCRISRRW